MDAGFPSPLARRLARGGKAPIAAASANEGTGLGARTRKLVGLFAISAFMLAYVVGATTIADRLPDSRAIELGYFVVAGTFWFVPILPLLYWMNRGR